MKLVAIAFIVLVTTGAKAHTHTWGKPSAPVIPQADGFFIVPGAAVAPRPTQSYKAIFDATKAADKPDQLLPALNMAGSELNLLAGTGVPLAKAKFAVVFHGAAMDGILNDTAYRAKFGRANPNLPVLSEMKRNGVELYVCGQNLAFENIDPKTLAPEVRVASDALIALMTFQAKGYALMSF